jgi:hypothetical protein
MAGTGRNNAAIRLLTKLPYEIERRTERARRSKNTGMRYDSKKPAQYMVAYAEELAAMENSLQPLSIMHMIRCVFTMGIDQHVDDPAGSFPLFH